MSLDRALQRPPRERSHTRICQLEAQLLEAVAHSRALELESSCTETNLVEATEHVNVLLEGNAELSREIACINEERRNLRRQTSMQQEKITLFQMELGSYKVQAEHQQVAVVQSDNARASDKECVEQMRQHFAAREEGLLEKVAMMQRAIRDVKQSTELTVAENATRWEETHGQLHSHAQRLQNQAAAETVQLRDAQQAQRELQRELQTLEMYEQAFQREHERKQFHHRRQLEGTKARVNDLLNMLHELEKGLVSGDDEVHLGDGRFERLPTL